MGEGRLRTVSLHSPPTPPHRSDFGVSLIANTRVAVLLAHALERCKSFTIRSLGEYYLSTPAHAFHAGE